MIKINTNMKYIHELLLIVAHELHLLEKYQLKYQLVENKSNLIFGTLNDYNKLNNNGTKYKLGPLFSYKCYLLPEVLYIENNNINIEDFNSDSYESTSHETLVLLEDVFGTPNAKGDIDQDSLFMFYSHLITDEDIKKVSFAINETVRILNGLDLYSKENMFEYFLICDQKTLTNISFQIYDFIQPIDPKSFIKINKYIKKM